MPEIRTFKGFSSRYHEHERYSIIATRALQTCLKLAAAHPHFERLTASSCSPSLPEGIFGRHPLFMLGCHMQLPDWDPEAYHIPIGAELDDVEKLLVDADNTRDFQWRNRCDHEQWYFSTCAVAIHALDRLSPTTRRNLRNVILHEESLAVVAPQSRKRTHSIREDFWGNNVYISRWCVRRRTLR
jgi:hypothetical protein